MKGKFGKTGLLCLALVLALGVGFAYWTGMLSIASTVKASDPGVEFSYQMSNDSATAADDITTGDPAEWGTWDYSGGINKPDTWIWGTDVQPGAKEVASIDCSITSNLLTATITNGYPGYVGGTAFTLHNTGTVQIEIDSIKLVKVSKDNVTYPVDVDLVACITVYVDAENGTANTTPTPATDDFSLHLGVGLARLIEPDGQAGDTVFGDIGIRVEPGAKELTSYDFTIEIAFSD